MYILVMMLTSTRSCMGFTAAIKAFSIFSSFSIVSKTPAKEPASVEDLNINGGSFNNPGNFLIVFSSALRF